MTKFKDNSLLQFWLYIGHKAINYPQYHQITNQLTQLFWWNPFLAYSDHNRRAYGKRRRREFDFIKSCIFIGKIPCHSVESSAYNNNCTFVIGMATFGTCHFWLLLRSPPLAYTYIFSPGQVRPADMWTTNHKMAPISRYVPLTANIFFTGLAVALCYVTNSESPFKKVGWANFWAASLALIVFLSFKYSNPECGHRRLFLPLIVVDMIVSLAFFVILVVGFFNAVTQNWSAVFAIVASVTHIATSFISVFPALWAQRWESLPSTGDAENGIVLQPVWLAYRSNVRFGGVKIHDQSILVGHVLVLERHRSPRPQIVRAFYTAQGDNKSSKQRICPCRYTGLLDRYPEFEVWSFELHLRREYKQKVEGEEVHLIFTCQAQYNSTLPNDNLPVYDNNCEGHSVFLRVAERDDTVLE